MHSFLNAIVKLKTVVKFILKCNCEIKNSCEIHLLVWTVFIGQSQGVAVNIVLGIKITFSNKPDKTAGFRKAK